MGPVISRLFFIICYFLLPFSCILCCKFNINKNLVSLLPTCTVTGQPVSSPCQVHCSRLDSVDQSSSSVTSLVLTLYRGKIRHQVSQGHVENPACLLPSQYKHYQILTLSGKNRRKYVTQGYLEKFSLFVGLLINTAKY